MHDPDTLVLETPKLWRFPTSIRIWHHEPKGNDSGSICPHYKVMESGAVLWINRWKWHVHHWRIDITAIKAFKSRWLTKCGWCGERKDGAWFGYQSSDTVYHNACQSAYGASKACTCKDPVLQKYGNYGPCERCGQYRQWNISDKQLEQSLIYKRVPKGERPSQEIIDRAKAKI